MQVEAAAALAPVLARFAIVVDGPMEAEVISRIVAGGDRATTMTQLAAPFPGRPEMGAAENVAVARGVLARLVASGTVEVVGGGYRIADPALAASLQRIVEAVTAGAAVRTPTTPSALIGAGVAPVAVEDGSRLQQAALGARRLVPQPVAALPAPARPVEVPSGWGSLVTRGWTPHHVSAQDAVVGVAVRSSTAPVAARVVVGDSGAPVALAAPRLEQAGPVAMAHLPAPPVRWGEGDPSASGALARAMAHVLATTDARLEAPLVVDRRLTPALALLARSGELPPVVVADLRSAPAEALAAAAAATPPRRWTPTRRGGRRDAASLLEVLFGPRFADGDGEAEDATSEPEPLAGLVVTSRVEDPQADALAELLGVEVLCLDAADDVAPEVVAWMDDDAGQTLLLPRA